MQFVTGVDYWKDFWHAFSKPISPVHPAGKGNSEGNTHEIY